MIGRVHFTEKVILEQRLEAGGELGVPYIQKKHIQRENNQCRCPKEEVCLASLKPVSWRCTRRPVHLGTPSQGRVEKEVREVTDS